MIFIKDAEELRFVHFNKIAEDLLGYSREELIGKNVHDLFPKDEADFFQAKDQEVLAGGRMVDIAEEPVHTKSGEVRIVHTKKIPLLDELGKPKYLLGISWDITEHKKADEALRARERYNRELFERLPIGLALCRMDGSLVDVNEAYARIIGRGIKETLGLTYWDITPEDYAADEQRQLESLRRTGRYGPYEKEYIHKDGRRVPVRLQGILMRENGGEFIWSSVEDISDKKHSETELLQKTKELARANAEKEQLEIFTYLASHDLQEPLQKIMGFGELLKTHANKSLDAKSADYLDRIQNAARRMTQLIHDLLNFSRVVTHEGEFTQLDPCDVIREVVGDIEFRINRSGGRIEIGELPPVHGDRVYLRQLFQNLITNALKFRKKNEPPLITIYGRRREDGSAEICVQDNGIGFDEKYLDRIFKPFERLHGWSEYEGSGMGLAICQKIVLRHKGQITAKSKPHEGSTFIITLPAGV